MGFDINRYKPKKKRSFLQVLKLRFKLYKRRNQRAWKKYDKKYKQSDTCNENTWAEEWIWLREQFRLKNFFKNISIFFICLILIKIVYEFVINNSDKIPEIGFVLLSLLGWVVRGVCWLLAIVFIFATIQNSLYSFAEKLFNKLYAKRQEAVADNQYGFYNYANKETNSDKLEEWRNEIMNKGNYPTAERISITIYPQIYNILLYFFPNSFKTDKEAYDYYNNFCERAEQLGEETTVYEGKKLLSNGIHIDIDLNMLSGRKTVWNYFYNNDSLCTMFRFFSYDELKNPELKKEIEQLYIDNWEFLESIDMCYLFSNGVDRSIRSRLDITPYGIDYYLPNWAGFDQFQFWFGQHQDIFQLPVDNIICSFRECATYYLKEEECKILEKQIKSYNCKDIIFHKLDFAKKQAEISNKFIHVYMNIKYFFPAETITNFNTGRKYRYIGAFDLDDYRRA